MSRAMEMSEVFFVLEKNHLRIEKAFDQHIEVVTDASSSIERLRESGAKISDPEVQKHLKQVQQSLGLLMACSLSEAYIEQCERDFKEQM